MTKKQIAFFIFLFATVAAVSGCGILESGIRNNESGIINPSDSAQDRQASEIDQQAAATAEGNASTTEEIAASGTGSVLASSTDAIDISDWQVYRNEEYGFEVKYPKNFLKQKIVGEFYKNEEYPEYGVKLFDNQSKVGTFDEFSINIFDKGWVDLGDDFFNREIFDFSDKIIADVEDLQKFNEFESGDVIFIGNEKMLKVMKSDNNYFVIKNKIKNKFIVFNISISGTSDKKINEYKNKIILEIIKSIKFQQ